MNLLLNKEIQQRADEISQLKREKIYTYCLEVASPCSHRITVDGMERINFISNNYLGFACHPKVKAAARSAIDTFGIGTGGSPLMCGTTHLHNRLKARIASVYGQEDTALFASGYQALVGAIQATIGNNDLAMLDSLVHRSIVDGTTLSGSDRRMWMHNDTDDLDGLLSRTDKKYQRKLVIVDSVYSMDGDIADLPGIRRVCDRHGALLLVDEAHALGVLGPHGHGILDHFHLPSGADVVAGTFSKFAGAVGGFVTGPAGFIAHLTHAASAFIFSASLPPTLCAAVLQSFELLESEPQWRQQLWANVLHLRDGLKSIGFDTGRSETPVIPLMIRNSDKAMQFNKMILDMGVYASPVVYPAVPPSQSRIRIGVMATHTQDDLDQSLEIFQRAAKALGLV